MSEARIPEQELALRRRRVVRTAWTVGIVAFVVYVAFILSGVLAA
jgi:hypothetical protein